ncbi:hypothetical protein cand_013150 [Cryptosporidium andersoni]|uniref:Metallo-beta-lactamase domain-containing protein n=1 Tax=Cryptosporidium andersoni TaxID=117008 RepID=A0A1J4MHQ9_9CRYT|nr:hypothetical protein cand_013150 [Cryptosporidium andersoni]
MLEAGILFLGTGASSCVPILHHVLESERYDCFCSQISKEHDSKIDKSKNIRNNVSIMIRIPKKDANRKKLSESEIPYDCVDNCTENHEVYHNILFDMGRTFRNSALSTFPKFKISAINSIILTHFHDDAVGGLNYASYFAKNTHGSNIPLPIYMNSDTIKFVYKRFHNSIIEELNRDCKILQLGYSSYELNVLDILLGRVTNCNSHEAIQYYLSLKDSINEPECRFNIVEFFIEDIKITSFPMYHGNCICMGFCIHYPYTNVIFISDYTFPIPKVSLDFLKSMEYNVSILILDSIAFKKSSNSHATISESLELAQIINPHFLYFVGMSCDLEYNTGNKKLQEILIQLKRSGKCCSIKSAQLAYDGLFLPINT